MKTRIWIWLAFFCFIDISLSAQQAIDKKRDYQWQFGTMGTNIGYQQSLLDFNQTPMAVSSRIFQMNTAINVAEICDTSGQLIMASNNTQIYNRAGLIMKDCVSLNPFTMCAETCILPAFILPQSGIDSMYYIFHNSLLVNDTAAYMDRFFYTTVNMNGDGSLGEVVESNHLILGHPMSQSHGACRHANGRDWWVITHDAFGNTFYRYLLTPTGLKDMGAIEVGQDWYVHYDSIHNFYDPNHGDIKFSSDGSTLVFIGTNGIEGERSTHLYVYDFDRCDGTISERDIEWEYREKIYIGGELSENGRYCYIATIDSLFQVDLEQDDLLSTKTLLFAYDGTTVLPPWAEAGILPFNTVLGFRIQRAPDGNIYLTAGGAPRLHTIHNANSAAPIFSYNEVILPNFNGNLTLPNYPYFRMGPVDGTVCDSLGLDYILMSDVSENKSAMGFQLYPNPSRDIAHISVEKGEIEAIVVFNMQGQMVQRSMIDKSSTAIVDISRLSCGTYLVQVQLEDGSSYNQKLVKM